MDETGWLRGSRGRGAGTRGGAPSAWLGRVVIIAALAVAGCNTVQQTIAFDDAQAAFARKQVGKGSGTVTGYAFVHARSGRTYTAGGDWITLIPATAYAEERMRIIYGGGRARPELSFAAVPGAVDETYASLTRREKADMHGKFTFEDVMPGRWFVVATVHWQAYDRDFGVDADHGFLIYDEVVVKPDETAKVVLSGN